ncbi:hypothetical protein [Sulfurospirillum cavolei]|uniref:hypothetical protein n=1 Tax=Sulfurospirillum cavolei TaxID=366522 RepID=UPI000764AC71|nr:hypothetical protein [Sulfurospirillum cavolei]MCD8545279.1 hypothetical protein [Sulfurospirillum cavolei]
MNETVLKVVVIIAILMMFVLLYVTGIAFVLNHSTTGTLFGHKLAALIILILLGIHAYLRRCTIRRLLQECIAIARNKHIRHEDNVEFLIRNTKNQSFQELCTWFGCDASLLRQKLLENHVLIQRTEDSLKTIAKENDKDLYEIFLLMIKLHVEQKNAPCED